MDRQMLSISKLAFFLINGPLCLLSTTANIFYSYCLIFPPCHRGRLKQPVKVLLGSVIFSSCMFFFSLALLYGVLHNSSEIAFLLSWLVLTLNVNNTMTCSVLLNFYYYIQIVPSQRALLIWIKKNIKSVIYMALSLNLMISFLDALLAVTSEILRDFIEINDTLTIYYMEELDSAQEISFLIIQVNIMCCLCIMMVSSFSTVHYLHRHIRSVACRNNSFSTPRIQSQMRAAITGLAQGMLCFLYGILYFFDRFTYAYSPHFMLSSWVSYTITSLYISGTTVNLGIGQAAFRQRAADVWRALKARVNTLCESTHQLADTANTVDIKVSL